MELFIKVSTFKHFLKHPQGPPAKPKKTGYCIPDISKIEKIKRGKGEIVSCLLRVAWGRKKSRSLN